MSPSIFHLEKFPHFLKRVVDLNRVHARDDPVHGALLLEGERRQSLLGQGDPEPDTLAGRTQRARRLLSTIHHEFPAGAPVHEQAAYLVRAFSGLRPFDEANHRTGWDYLAETLQHNGHELLAGEDEGRVLGNEVWHRLGSEEGTPALGPADVLERDAAFEYLVDWFHHRIA